MLKKRKEHPNSQAEPATSQAGEQDDSVLGTTAAQEEVSSDAAAPKTPKHGLSVRTPRGTLGAILVEEGIITQGQLTEALRQKEERGGFLGKILVELKYIDQNTLVSFLVKQCKIPHISLVDYEITGDLFKYVPEETCAEYHLLPIDKLGKILTVAMVDPLDIEALEQIRTACPDLKIKPILCDWDHFELVSRRLFDVEATGPEEVTADSFGFVGSGSALRGSRVKETAGQEDEEDLPEAVEALEDSPPGETAPVERAAPIADTVEAFPRSRARKDKGRTSSKAELDVMEALEGPGLRTRSDERVRALLETEKPLKHYEFEGFFVGPENAFTLSLARAVALAPGTEYNPFYLCSGAGLGKTHLINAIGNEIDKSHADLRVGYVSATRFAQHVTEAAAQNQLGAFRDHYCRWDVLLFDDLHFLAGRPQAQEELLHLFDAFWHEKRQLVIAGGGPPEESAELNPSLASRFSAGIVASLRPPEWETRMEILQHFANAANADVPDDILGLIARKVPDDVRRMSGALRKVIAFARLVGQDITKDLVNEILSHLGVDEAA
jgi:chromosomal replication initiator protein DnaA